MRALECLMPSQTVDDERPLLTVARAVVYAREWDRLSIGKVKSGLTRGRSRPRVLERGAFMEVR